MQRMISIFCLIFASSLYSMGKTPNEMLLRGAREDDIKIVEEALALAKKSIRKFDINVKDPQGHTALLFAAWKNNEEMIKLLLENQADPNLSNDFGAIPLMFAVNKEKFNIAKLLLNKGANPNFRGTFGDTPFNRAAVNNYPGMLELLLDNGGNPNILDERGDTALMRLLKFKVEDQTFRSPTEDRCGESEKKLKESDFIRLYLDVLNMLLKVTNLDLRYGNDKKTLLEIADLRGLKNIADLIRRELQRRRLIETEVASCLLPELENIVSGYLYPQ